MLFSILRTAFRLARNTLNFVAENPENFFLNKFKTLSRRKSASYAPFIWRCKNEGRNMVLSHIHRIVK